jgi:Cu2+-containing amine oxidase
MRGLSYYKGKSRNYYGNPIEGVLVTANLNTRKVVDLIDTGLYPFHKKVGTLMKSSKKVKNGT